MTEKLVVMSIQTNSHMTRSWRGVIKDQTARWRHTAQACAVTGLKCSVVLHPHVQVFFPRVGCLTVDTSLLLCSILAISNVLVTGIYTWNVARHKWNNKADICITLKYNELRNTHCRKKAIYVEKKDSDVCVGNKLTILWNIDILKLSCTSALSLTCLFPHVDERHDIWEPWTGAKRHPDVVQAGVWVIEPRPLHTDHANLRAVAVRLLRQLTSVALTYFQKKLSWNTSDFTSNNDMIVHEFCRQKIHHENVAIRNNKHTVSVSVSAQNGIVALEKAHERSAPSLWSLVKVALETVPMFVCWNTDRFPSKEGECRPLLFSILNCFLQAINAVILWSVDVPKVPPLRISCPAKLQTRYDVCCACQSICPFILTDSDMLRVVDSQKSSQPNTWLYASRRIQFQTPPFAADIHCMWT